MASNVSSLTFHKGKPVTVCRSSLSGDDIRHCLQSTKPVVRRRVLLSAGLHAVPCRPISGGNAHSSCRSASFAAAEFHGPSERPRSLLLDSASAQRRHSGRPTETVGVTPPSGYWGRWQPCGTETTWRRCPPTPPPIPTSRWCTVPAHTSPGPGRSRSVCSRRTATRNRNRCKC